MTISRVGLPVAGMLYAALLGCGALGPVSDKDAGPRLANLNLCAENAQGMVSRLGLRDGYRYGLGQAATPQDAHQQALENIARQYAGTINQHCRDQTRVQRTSQGEQYNSEQYCQTDIRTRMTYEDTEPVADAQCEHHYAVLLRWHDQPLVTRWRTVFRGVGRDIGDQETRIPWWYFRWQGEVVQGHWRQNVWQWQVGGQRVTANHKSFWQSLNWQGCEGEPGAALGLDHMAQTHRQVIMEQHFNLLINVPRPAFIHLLSILNSGETRLLISDHWVAQAGAFQLGLQADLIDGQARSNEAYVALYSSTPLAADAVLPGANASYESLRPFNDTQTMLDRFWSLAGHPQVTSLCAVQLDIDRR